VASSYKKNTTILRYETELKASMDYFSHLVRPL